MASSKTLQAIVEIAGSLSPTLGKAAEEASKSLEGINLKAVAVGAGVAAAVAAAMGTTTQEVNIRRVQKELLRQGVYLGDAERLKQLGLS